MSSSSSEDLDNIRIENLEKEISRTKTLVKKTLKDVNTILRLLLDDHYIRVIQGRSPYISGDSDYLKSRYSKKKDKKF